MNGAVPKVNKKFISHFTRAKRIPSAAATVQVFHALPAVRFSCLLRGQFPRWSRSRKRLSVCSVLRCPDLWLQCSVSFVYGLEKTHHAWCVFSKPCTALHCNHGILWVDSPRLLTVAARVQFQVSPCEICGGKTVMLRVLLSFLVNIDAPMSCTAYLSIKEHHRRVILAADRLIKEETSLPCLHDVTSEKSAISSNSFLLSRVPLRNTNKQG